MKWNEMKCNQIKSNQMDMSDDNIQYWTEISLDRNLYLDINWKMDWCTWFCLILSYLILSCLVLISCVSWNCCLISTYQVVLTELWISQSRMSQNNLMDSLPSLNCFFRSLFSFIIARSLNSMIIRWILCHQTSLSCETYRSG
jgi:uncharacterized membrane protein